MNKDVIIRLKDIVPVFTIYFFSLTNIFMEKVRSGVELPV
jgi:hypothetical protein